MRTFLGGVVVALIAAVGVASPAFAKEGDVTWTVRTASNSFGADRSSFAYTVNPGGTVQDAMVVANRGKAPVTLAVYTADGFTTDAGRLDLRPKADQPKAIGAWVKPGPASITIAAGKTQDVPFTLAVPANATPGDYVGGILTTMTQPDTTAGINVERRLGIRIKLRVGGELAPALTVENTRITYEGTADPFASGGATVTYTVHNTGNAILSAKQDVTVTGPFGWFTAPTSAIAAPPELLPGETWPVTVKIKGVTPAVRLSATVTLTPLLTDAAGSTSSLPAVEATTHGWAVPWIWLIALVVLALLIVATVLLSRRRAAKRKRAEDARVQEAVEQALKQKDAV